MNKFCTLVFIAISFNSFAQLNSDCIYVDPNILIINCGIEDRYKISEAVSKMKHLKAKVIVVDFIFFDKRPMDSVFIKGMTGKTPIVLTIGTEDDSSYFKIDNCYNGLHGIVGNEGENVEFLFPFVKYNGKLRDSYELLTLKYFDYKKYSEMKAYLMSFDLSSHEVKAEIEFNGNSLSCFYSIGINNLEDLREEFVEDKIVILGYFGVDPDIPLEKDLDRFAYQVRMVKGRKTHYMYSTLISANIISNLIRTEMRESDLKKIRK